MLRKTGHDRAGENRYELIQIDNDKLKNNDMKTETTQLITLLGVILSFVIGTLGLWVGLRNSRKTNYINSVTASRIRYIQDIRNRISEFCGLVYSYNAVFYTSDSLAATPEKMFELKKELNKLKYLIKLLLNPEDAYWDDKILNSIDDINNSIMDEDPKEKIDKLIILTQFLLKLEWEGAKMESKRGILSKRKKSQLYQKHVQLYEKHLEKTKKNT